MSNNLAVPLLRRVGLSVTSPAAAQGSHTAGFPLQSLTQNVTRMTREHAPLLFNSGLGNDNPIILI